MKATHSMDDKVPSHKRKQVTPVTKCVTMRCPARQNADGTDRCGDPITVYYGETTSDLWYIESVTPCQYHTPSEAYDAPYTIDELEQRLNEGYFTFPSEAA